MLDTPDGDEPAVGTRLSDGTGGSVGTRLLAAIKPIVVDGETVGLVL